MKMTSTKDLQEGADSSYDRLNELKAFDDSKVGVQGLIEKGVTKIPLMFHSGDSDLNDGSTSESSSNFSIPTIDLSGIYGDSIQRYDVVGKIKDACEKWGFFQITNHGIPSDVLNEMIKGGCSFHQQDAEVRKQYYTRDLSRKVIYVSNITLYQDPSANWRDTLACFMAPHPPKPEELPAICRDIVIEYSKKIKELASTLFELLSEALGLNRLHLNEMGCGDGVVVICQYYPKCPEPELTMGASKHTDGDFMTILLQDHMCGLQILHENQWVDVPPMHGVLIVNIGDLLQLMSNDKFISVQHRVLAQNIEPRTSVASFFMTYDESGEGSTKVYSPIKELLSKETPPVYRGTSLKEFSRHRYKNRVGASLSHFKL